MPRYYLDLHEPGRVTVDDDGEELLNVSAAETKAIQSLGEIIRHFSPKSGDDLAIEVREGGQPIMRVSVNLQVTKIV